MGEAVSQKPIVTVLLPVYNASKFLIEAINSILNQTFVEFEFLIIDDGSSDDSISIINRFAKTDRRIRVISRQNRGLVYTLNEGIESARGTYIARMDADDVSDPRRIESQVNLMERENLDICGCHYEIINENGKFIDAVYCPLTDDSLLLFLCEGVPFAHGSVTIRKSFLDTHNIEYGGEFKFAEDKALWIELFREGARFGNVDKLLFTYREVNGSLSKKRKKLILDDNVKLRRTLINENEQLFLESLSNLWRVKENLSYRELEHLHVTSLRAAFYYRRLGLIKEIFYGYPRYVLISLFKFILK
jgi:glycosyltransferase involved in cell wall biosynthesis